MNSIANDNPHLDSLLFFTLDHVHVRGKLVRLAKSVNQIVKQHNYPLPVAMLIAELVTAVALIGADLKNNGMITAQLQSDQGPVQLLIADYFENGKLRAYARFDKEFFINNSKEILTYSQITANMRLVVTIDFGQVGSNPYQGIIELDGGDLGACFSRYFRESVQIPTYIKTKVIRLDETLELVTFGAIVQKLPGTEQVVEVDAEFAALEAYLVTVSDAEILDANMDLSVLGVRLFHEYGLSNLALKSLYHGCKCSREKAERSLSMLSARELEEIKTTEGLVVSCQFCGKEEYFT